MAAVLAPLGRAATYRSLLFLSSALVTGSVALGLLLAGWLLAAGVVSLTPLVVPVLVGFRATVGAFARGESWLARKLLGANARGGKVSTGGKGFWARGGAVLTDRGFWREQAYLTLRTVVGAPLAILVLSLLGSSLWFIALPIYYRWVNLNTGFWHVDSLQKAVLLMPVGAIGLVLTLNLVRPLAAASRGIAEALLRPDDERRRLDTRALRRRALRAHVVATAVANAVVLIVWAAVGAGGFWPAWVILGTSLALALHGWVHYALSRDDWRRRRGVRPLVLHAGISVTLSTSYVLMWALSGGGYFWPVWAILGFTIALGTHAFVVYRRGPVVTEMQERIDVLESTRAGAVDVQESEARRIERDLHDGAQARLVALGMNLGMAEQRLAADPEAARGLLTEARLGVEEALRELRELARGIHPPVLTDRGLEAAIAALAHRSAIPVHVTADVPERPPAAVETAAYFVAAEALTNAAKHAGASHIEVRLVREPRALVVEVADDGRGGADPSGSGLTGLRRRVEALDGKLTVVSPPGGGTTLHAELPCAS